MKIVKYKGGNLIKAISKHLQGNEAVKMFKEYGGIKPASNNSSYGVLLKYVPEARERYGLIGNTDITDEEIAQSIYKHSKLNGMLDENGEPIIGFRGDTRGYTELKPKLSVEEYLKDRASTDNALGMETLQGDFTKNGIERYLYTETRPLRSVPDQFGRFPYQVSKPYQILADPDAPTHYGQLGIKFKDYTLLGETVPVYKYPANLLPSKVNQINGFMFKPGTKIYDMDDAFYRDGAYGAEFVPHANRYLKESQEQGAGLLRAVDRGDDMLEHSANYLIVPNHGIEGAKNILPYDLRVPRNWKDKNIFRSLAPIGLSGWLLGNYVGSKSNKDK